MKVLRILQGMLPLAVASAMIVCLPVRAQMPSAPRVEIEREGEWSAPKFTQQRFDFTVDMPLSEVVRRLLEPVKQGFDVIWPQGNDSQQIDMKFELKNVSVVEVFQAMNLQFELSSSPVRWALIMNGERPTAILKVVPLAKPARSGKRTVVFYVGDLISNRSPTNSFETEAHKIQNAIRVAQMQAGVGEMTFSAYPPGELAIITGTEEQIALAREVLSALAQQAAFERAPMLRPMPERRFRDGASVAPVLPGRSLREEPVPPVAPAPPPPPQQN